MKIVKKFQLKIIIFSGMKNRCILHERVLVMILLCLKLNDSLIAIWRFLIGINTSYQYDEMQRSIIIDMLASCSQNSFTLC